MILHVRNVTVINRCCECCQFYIIMFQITKYSYRWATSINVYDAVLSNVMLTMMDPLMPLLHLLTSLWEGLRCQEMKVSFHGSWMVTVRHWILLLNCHWIFLSLSIVKATSPIFFNKTAGLCCLQLGFS